MVTLGLDIGTNSVGSAWVDTDQKLIELGVGIFPAGIEDSDEKGRGEPKGRERRQARQIRRVLFRRAARRRALTKALIEHGLLPTDAVGRQKLWESNPWHLRREALSRALTAHEFGRVLVHLAQRRGAFGVHVRDEQEDATGDAEGAEKQASKKGKGAASPEGKVKQAIEAARGWLKGRTFGQAMADEYDARQHAVEGKVGKFYQDPIRNRRDSYWRCADRDMIRSEFLRIWEAQKSLQPFGGELAKKLADESFKILLDEPSPGDVKKATVFRHAGLIFEQRRHYWDVGTLGRCDLEPTDRCCPVADMHAQYFRVVETVNNLRLWVRGQDNWRALTPGERTEVINRLREQKTGSVAAIREALRIDKRSLKKKGEPEDFYKLNIEADDKREINTDRFWSEVVQGVIGEAEWGKWDEKRREWVNRELLRLDPESPGDDQKLKRTAVEQWGLDAGKADLLVEAWRKRAKSDTRLKLSRKAIVNLLPYLDRPIVDKDGEPSWPTVTDARQAFALDKSNGATLEQRARYAHWVNDPLRNVLLDACAGDLAAVERLLSLRGMNAKDRHYVGKHAGQLPPPPMLSNPVVRKAIHEVRRHVDAYMVKFGKKPDRIVIEMARDATQPKKMRDQELRMNRERESIRREIIEEYGLNDMSSAQKEKAFQRVLLCRQQREHCAYSGAAITERDAVAGTGGEGAIEIDHVIPQACGGGDDWSNKVVCYVKANRDKGRRSPHQWLDAARLEKMEKVFEHLLKVGRGVDATGYFTANDCKRKWDNLHRDPKADREDWRPSQLTDTSYAATEVARYLQSALYPDAPVDVPDVTKRKIIFTKGRYTAKLREDWQLFQHLRDASGTVPGGSIKDRYDHRHHAIDAVVIACTNEKVLQQIGRAIREYDERRLGAKERNIDPDAVPKPEAVAPPSPWGGISEFRHAVLSRLFEEFDGTGKSGCRSAETAPGRDGLSWAVSHRPRKRKIVDCLHEATAYGPVLKPDGSTSPTEFTNRIGVERLSPNHLRVPDQWDELQARLAGSNIGTIRREMTQLVDPPPGKSGIVRDRKLRSEIRECLRGNGVDPDRFSPGDMKALCSQGKLRMRSGVPIRSVVLLRTISDPVRIERSEDRREDRVYISGNNHHVEIRQNVRGQWKGEVVRTFDAAQRKVAQLRSLRKARRDVVGLGLPLDQQQEALHTARQEAVANDPIVDRRDRPDGKFVMSLAEGEMVRMVHPTTRRPGLFVVFKIDPSGAIHFTPHWDARRAKGENDVEGSQREDVDNGIVASTLQGLGIAPGEPPVKVRVSPLGEIIVMAKD